MACCVHTDKVSSGKRRHLLGGITVRGDIDDNLVDKCPGKPTLLVRLDLRLPGGDAVVALQERTHERGADCPLGSVEHAMFEDLAADIRLRLDVLDTSVVTG